jgi:hypothetical protein
MKKILDYLKFIFISIPLCICLLIVIYTISFSKSLWK